MHERKIAMAKIGRMRSPFLTVPKLDRRGVPDLPGHVPSMEEFGVTVSNDSAEVHGRSRKIFLLFALVLVYL